MGLLRRTLIGDELTEKEKKSLRRTMTDLASVVPIGVLMLLPVISLSQLFLGLYAYNSATFFILYLVLDFPCLNPGFSFSSLSRIPAFAIKMGTWDKYIIVNSLRKYLVQRMVYGL